MKVRPEYSWMKPSWGIVPFTATAIAAAPVDRRGGGCLGKRAEPEHPDVGASLNSLAGLYDDQGRYAEAEQLYRAEAVKWWRLAAEQGDASAQYSLGLAHAKGQGVPQDYANAVKWFRKAGEQGHP